MSHFARPNCACTMSMTWKPWGGGSSSARKSLGNGLALAVSVEDDPHGRAGMVFFLDCRHKFLRAGVLHAFAHAAVRAQEVDPSHGQRGVRRFPGIRFFGVSTSAAFSAT